ncbi:FkbM family methyltransferase [Candidatus Dojkabacteria bacterium]|jgi:FkbM family methyltransferase|nr:FkbM family methyltransferase [Candidatus Dojkabacteria bacterium]
MHPTPYNTEYARQEFNEHGEDWLLFHLQDKLKTIFDVGSNIGEWSKMAREFNPSSRIHTFEIIPETYEKLLINLKGYSGITFNSFGLSDECGRLLMKYRPDCDTVCTYLPNLELENSSWITGLTFTGDMYMESRRICYIDFLKIDVEGAEGKVLEGFQDALKQAKVGIVQFEYGRASILSKFLLVDAYEMLRPLGYKLGRLGRGWVDFKEYHLLDEDFNGPDFVAVHESVMSLYGF